MIRPAFRLSLALIVSFLLHGLPFLPDLLPAAKPPRRPPPLVAELRTPPPLQPELMLKEPAPAPVPDTTRPSPPSKVAPVKPTPRPPKAGWLAEVQKQFKKLDERGLFYPPEAIARGLQGEVLVLLFLNEAGEVAAARVEQGSGHTVLDEAALRAVRSLRSLPADAPRESLLPVRFRLH